LDAEAHEFDTDLRKLPNTCLSFCIMIFDKENNDRGQSSSEQCLLCSFQRKSQRDCVGGLGGLVCPTLGNHTGLPGSDQKERVVLWSKSCPFVSLHSIYSICRERTRFANTEPESPKKSPVFFLR